MTTPTSAIARVAVALLLLLAGIVIGVVAVAVHELWWGLPLAGAAVLACLVALPGGWWRRLPFALGVATGVAVLTPPRPEGDYLITGDVRGYVLLAGAFLTLLVGIVTVRAR